MATRHLWREHFFGGAAAVSTSLVWYNPWKHTQTGGGTCVIGTDNGSTSDAAGIMKLGNSSTTQVENNCLSWGDVLSFALDKKPIWRTRFRLGQASLDTASSWCAGLCGDRNDTINSIAQRMIFKMVGSTSQTIAYVATDDGTTDSGDISTTIALGTGWNILEIDARVQTNILFFMLDANGNRTRVAQGTTFSMAAYSGSLQPYFQFQKTSDNNQDYMQADYTEVEWEI